MDDLARVIARIHAARGIVIERGMRRRISIFAASARTWKRWLGNLIDNACKWARRRGCVVRCVTAWPRG